MLFYKIEGMLEGNTFSEDGGHPPAGGKEFQGKQELFAKKLQGKCYLSISQIRDGRITLAASEPGGVQHPGPVPGVFPGDRYRVLKPRRPGGHLRRAALPAFLRRAVRLFGGTTRTCTRCSTSASCSTTPTISTRPCCRAAFPWRSRRGRQPNCFARTPSIRSWSASTRGPRCWWEAATLSHYLLVCGEGEARNRQVELLLSALYQNGRIHSQRATWKAYDYDDRVDRDLLDSLYQASSGGAMVLSYNPEGGAGGGRASAGLEVVMELCRAIRNYQSQTLTVLCLSPEGETAKKLFYENLGPLTFVELREDVVGRGTGPGPTWKAWRRTPVCPPTRTCGRAGRRTGVTGPGNCASFLKAGTPKS